MPSSRGTLRAKASRIELVVHDGRITGRQYRELSDFVQYCVARIEREVGLVERWQLTVTATRGGFTSTAHVADGEYAADGAALAFDRSLAVWDAMSRLEEGLRELRHVSAATPAT
jgi:hypothetical protein